MRTYDTPEAVNVDAYQAGHFQLVPPGMLDFQCSQGVFRKPLRYGGDERADQRLLSAGMRAYVENNLMCPELYSLEGIKQAEKFYSTFHASSRYPYCKPYPFPKELFEKIATIYEGVPPIVIMALPDGQAHYVGEPHVQVFCNEPGMGELVGWIESSMLPYLWTSSVVATRGRVRKDGYIGVYKKVYPDRSDSELAEMCAYKFHDFGRRGGASTQITGVAHLINWLGTDSCDSAFVAQMYYNDGKPFGASSIMAAAHRTVTPWPTEADAMHHAIELFGNGFLAFVADSYNYIECMKQLAQHAKVIETKGGFLVGRPDSGDVVESVIQGMRIFEDYGFGLDAKATAEASGLKVLNLSGVLQGDGVSDTILFSKLFPAVISAGYSPCNLGIGMGEYNHRAVRSDTEMGYKTCLVGTANLDYEDWRRYEPRYAQVMKGSENLWKRSLPCPVGVASNRIANRVYPVSVADLVGGKTGDLKIVFDGRPGVRNRTPNWELFEATRKRAWESWRDLSPVPTTDPFDPEIRKMQEQYMFKMGASLARL